MNKKILIGIGIAVGIAIIVGLFIYFHKPIVTKEQLIQKFSEFETLYQQKKNRGFNVSQAEELLEKAKRAFDKGNYIMANSILDKAFIALDEAKISEKVKKDARERLLKVKIASWYQTITDYQAFNRTADDVITHLKDTRTEFVFRAFWRYKVIPEDCSDLSSPIQRQKCEKAGFSYSDLKEMIREIKKEEPNIIICVGIPTERINAIERDPITGETFDSEEVWKMALDPKKWGLPITKEEFQADRARLLGFASGSKYNWKKANAYYPDITNPKFQKLQLDWAKKLIDCGVDAIWIDMLFAQARMFYEITGDVNHPAVKESYKAALKLVDEIHKYGLEKYGKYIYVGGWTNFIEIPDYPNPDFDFVVNMIWEQEVANKTLWEERWDTFFSKVKNRMGNNILVLVFMDEAAVRWQDQPLGIFSQQLSKQEQKEYLRKADAFFSEKRKEHKLPIVFVYPLHGGWMGNNAEILSYGKFKVYDSLAPEFETYETIKELAQRK